MSVSSGRKKKGDEDDYFKNLQAIISNSNNSLRIKRTNSLTPDALDNITPPSSHSRRTIDRTMSVGPAMEHSEKKQIREKTSPFFNRGSNLVRADDLKLKEEVSPQKQKTEGRQFLSPQKTSPTPEKTSTPAKLSETSREKSSTADNNDSEISASSLLGTSSSANSSFDKNSPSKSPDKNVSSAEKKKSPSKSKLHNESEKLMEGAASSSRLSSSLSKKSKKTKKQSKIHTDVDEFGVHNLVKSLPTPRRVIEKKQASDDPSIEELKSLTSGLSLSSISIQPEQASELDSTMNYLDSIHSNPSTEDRPRKKSDCDLHRKIRRKSSIDVSLSVIEQGSVSSEVCERKRRPSVSEVFAPVLGVEESTGSVADWFNKSGEGQKAQEGEQGEDWWGELTGNLEEKNEDKPKEDTDTSWWGSLKLGLEETSNNPNQQAPQEEVNKWKGLKDEETNNNKNNDSNDNEEEWSAELRQKLLEGGHSIESINSSSSESVTKKRNSTKRDSVFNPKSRKSVIKHLRDPEMGLKTSTKTHIVNKYAFVFEGSELVDWLLKHQVCNSRSDAVRYGADLMEEKVFDNAVGDKAFHDDKQLYRFAWDMKVVQRQRTTTTPPLSKSPDRGSRVEYNPENLTQKQRDLVTLLQDRKKGLPVADRTYHLATYANVFDGKSLVTWLIKNKVASSRPDATEIGQLLLEKGVFSHVLQHHEFKDEVLFYRFAWDSSVPNSRRSRAYSLSVSPLAENPRNSKRLTGSFGRKTGLPAAEASKTEEPTTPKPSFFKKFFSFGSKSKENLTEKNSNSNQDKSKEGSTDQKN